MHKWRGSLKRKQALFPQSELFSESELRGNMRELTRRMVQRHTDFGTLENYLDGYSIAGDTLSALPIPAAILTAEDDPAFQDASSACLRFNHWAELTCNARATADSSAICRCAVGPRISSSRA